MYPTTSNNTVLSQSCSPMLVAGPEWRSFEQFRIGGSTALEGVASGSVASLRVKSNTFRILRDEDFQKLVGLAAEVHRLKHGLTFVMKAAKIVAKYPNDRDSIELLCHSVSFLGESAALPERDGHDMFRITEEEARQHREEDLDLSTLQIPRPNL